MNSSRKNRGDAITVVFSAARILAVALQAISHRMDPLLHLETAIVGHGVGAPKLQMTTDLHHSRRLHLKTVPFILLSVILAPLGNVLLGKGMKRVGSFKSVTAHNFLSFIERTFSSPWLWLGIACLVSFFVVQMLLLTWADYSYVQPASALSYGFVAILSYLILGEVASPLRWTGIAVICAGVLIVGRTSPQSTGPA